VQPSDIEYLKGLIEEIKLASKAERLEKITRLLSMDCWIPHHQDRKTKCVVLAAYEEFEYPHEHHTCKKLTAAGYNVILVPKGYFKRNEKKFDVFLSRGHIFLESDLKCITTANVDTIGKRIKEGSEQSSRLVLDIISPVKKPELIDGLKTGCERNKALIELMLFYNSCFYRLKKDLILSRNIYKVIK
jgi:hypothetical protein